MSENLDREPEIIADNKESSVDNIKQIERVKQSIQKELNGLERDIAVNYFFEKKESKVVYHMDLVKNYLESCLEKAKDQKDVHYSAALIMAIQIALEYLGYDIGKIDGIYKASNTSEDSKTQTGIKKFQEENELKKADGIPGKKTITKILEELNSKLGESDNSGVVNQGEEVVNQGEEVVNQGEEVVNQGEEVVNQGEEVVNQGEEVVNQGEEVVNQEAEKKKENVINLIAALPEKDDITLNDKDKVTAARQVYEALADNSGINIEKLTKAEAKIRELEAAEAERSRLETEAKAAKENVKNLIANLPEENVITTNDKSTITAARQAYEALADKSGINTDKLTKAEAKIQELEIAEEEKSRLDAEAVAKKNNVITLIEKLPEENDITLNDENTITAARQAYEALADKSGINTDKLTKAEAKIQELEAAKKAAEEKKSRLEAEMKISNVINLINELPEASYVTIENRDQINEANNAYNQLNSNLKTKIDINTTNKLNSVYKALRSKTEIAIKERIEGTKIPENWEEAKAMNILQYNNGSKLEAKEKNQLGGIGSSIMKGFEDVGSFKNMEGITSATTRSKRRFEQKGDELRYNGEELGKYCNDRRIKSFMFYFGGNEKTSTSREKLKLDIEKWGNYLEQRGIQPVLCTCIGEKIPDHKDYNTGEYYLPDLNMWIRTEGQIKGWPVIDFALIDKNGILRDGDNLHPDYPDQKSGEVNGYHHMVEKIGQYIH